MDDEETQCKVEYLDLPDGSIEEANWIKRSGRARVTYPNGHIFEGTYDAEKIRQGYGCYIWMAVESVDDETMVEKARYEGNYRSGLKSGFGKMIFPSGDIYEGEWVDNKIHGEGSYTYKKSSDIYSGSWVNGKKHGPGRYEFGADSSMLVGTWSNGQIVNGSWELNGAGKFDGFFKLGRPYGSGKFTFSSGLQQTGAFIEVIDPNEEPVEPNDDEASKPPSVQWKGDSIVTM